MYETKRNIPKVAWNKIFDLNYIFSFYEKYDIELMLDNLRKSTIIENSKKPIILFGCSFTHGGDLSDEDTFSYQLSHYVNRSVYNYGIPGGSPKETLYLLRYYNELAKIRTPDYVIYTYISDHKKRLYYYSWIDHLYDMPCFNRINNHLEYDLKKRKFLHKSRFAILLSGFLANKKAELPETNDLLNLYFTEIHREIKTLYSNTKFVILVYEEDGTENWDYIKAKGIEIIKADELTDEKLHSVKYQISPEDIHPNAKAWKVIIPPLVKKLNTIIPSSTSINKKSTK